MTILATILNNAAVIVAASNAATSPTMGYINSYDASASSNTTTVAVTLPQLSTLSLGATCIVTKSETDTTVNPISFTPYTGDTFGDGRTNFVLSAPGQKVTLQVVQNTPATTNSWAIVGISELAKGLASTSPGAVLPVTVASGTETTVVQYLPAIASEVVVGSTFRIRLNGTIVFPTGYTALTFKTYFLSSTAMAQTVAVPTGQAAAASPGVPFYLDTVIQVRSATTAIAQHWGAVQFPAGNQYLTSTSTSTSTISLSSTTTPSIKMTAAWAATYVATSSLTVSTAYIERVI